MTRQDCRLYGSFSLIHDFTSNMFVKQVQKTIKGHYPWL